MATFDLSALRAELYAFRVHVPRVLRKSTLTLDLADEVERCMLESDGGGALAMAIAGQMKAGKSTLINALVGEDLAITGVTETTATLNWIRHGNEQQAKEFRIVWDDSSDETRDYAERVKWVGDSTLAKRTQYLEFFSTAEFLQKVHIVDTPGTRSVLPDHPKKTDEFLLAEDRSELDTMVYGGQAACVVYVLRSVVHEHDEDFLEQFASNTQLPNFTVYNSVAVLHKWEGALAGSAEPWADARLKAANARSALQHCVADVIPVSGPLGLAARRCSDRFWNDIVRLVEASTAEALQYVLKLAERFTEREKEGCAMNASERTLLLNEFHRQTLREEFRDGTESLWACLLVILRLATVRRFGNGEALRAAVHDLSGIDELMAFLQKRFFDRSRLIQASRRLRNALIPANKARNRLRARSAMLENRLDRGRAAIADLQGNRSGLAAARTFVDEIVGEAEREINEIKPALQELEEKTRSVRESFAQFDGDLRGLGVVDACSRQFPERERAEITTILGGYGYELNERMQIFAVADGDQVNSIERRMAYWLEEAERADSEERRFVIDQVLNRLEAALQVLGQNVEPVR